MNVPVNEVSQAEFARLRGCSAALVTKWKQSGRLVMTEDGKRVLVEESTALLDQTLDPARGGDRTAAPAAKSAAGSRGGRGGDSTGYHAAASEEKRERTAKLRLERMELEGSLVSRAQVEAEARARSTQAREALLAIPDRLSAQLAAEVDADKVRGMLESEIRHVCSQLALRQADEPAERAA